MAATKPRTRRTQAEIDRDRRAADMESAKLRQETAQANLAAARAEQALRLYDAASVTDDRRPRRGTGASGNAVMQHAGARLRDTARYLDENDGNAIAILDDLVDNTIGTGVTIEPMVMTPGGDLAQRANRAIKTAWDEWWERPEITGLLPGTEVERLMARSLYRDGEVLTNHIETPAAPHVGALTYSLEMLESDYLPFDAVQASTRNPIVHGIERDDWGRHLAYWVYLRHPGDISVLGARAALEVKRVPAAQMTHLAFRRRLHQVRGASILHGAINTLYDIKEAWESERIAMRVAAAMTGFVRRGADWESSAAITANVNDSSIGARTMEMAPGMVFDVMGDEVGTIGHDRPNAQFDPFTQALQRQMAGATGTRYSSITNRYDGTYSAQRQELVEGSVAYRRLFAYLLGVFYRPVWRRFVSHLRLDGILGRGDLAGVDMATLARAEFRPPALPWIDPEKEMKAYALAVEQRFQSRHQVIRDRGGDPAEVDKQIDADTPPPPTPAAPPPAATQQDEEEGRALASVRETLAALQADTAGMAEDTRAAIDKSLTDIEARRTSDMEQQTKAQAAALEQWQAREAKAIEARHAAAEANHEQTQHQLTQLAESMRALTDANARDRDHLDARLAPIERWIDTERSDKARIRAIISRDQPELAAEIEAAEP